MSRGTRQSASRAFFICATTDIAFFSRFGRSPATGASHRVIPGRFHSASEALTPWDRPSVLHRHQRLWRDPEMFEPSRFLPGAPQPARFAYMPFGIGRRTCIGTQFTLTELVLGL